MADTTTKKQRPKTPKLAAVKLDPKVSPEHFTRWEPQMRALSDKDLAASNVNITRAVTVAIGAHANLAAARDEVLSTLSNVRVEAVDDLPSLAYAAWHADLLWRVAIDPSLSCADLMPEAEDLRETLLLQARAQAKRKRIPQSLLDTVEPGVGIEDRANDLTVLAHAFRSRWRELEGRIDVSLAELDRADELAALLLGRLAARAVSARKEGELSPGELRARAWTLLVNAYEECRRAAAAVWWYEPGGWEQFVPALRSAQNRGATRGADDDTPPPAPPTPA
jgi:hypothetical protein